MFIVVIGFLQNTIVQVRSYYVIQVSYSLLDSISEAMGHGICSLTLSTMDTRGVGYGVGLGWEGG